MCLGAMLVTTHISFGLILFIVSLIDFRVGCTVALQHLLGCTVAIGTHASALTLLHSRFCTRAFARTLLHSLFGTYTSAFNRMHIGHRRSHFGTHSSVFTRWLLFFSTRMYSGHRRECRWPLYIRVLALWLLFFSTVSADVQ